jgi:hypothetical protein
MILNKADMMIRKMIMGTMAAIVLTIGFTMIDFLENPSASSMTNPTVEKTYAPEANSNTIALGVDADHGDSIFSFSSFLSLCLVVLAIVTFRKNSYV